MPSSAARSTKASRSYFSLIRNFRRLSWLLIYLFGASPAICKSFVKDAPHGLEPFDEGSLYLPHATLAKIYEDNSLSIGRTPLVRINRIAQNLGCTVLAKIEGRNPAYSVKCRLGAALIWAAERDGILIPGSRDVTIVEPTSGNTGIALAFVAAARGLICPSRNRRA